MDGSSERDGLLVLGKSSLKSGRGNLTWSAKLSAALGLLLVARQRLPQFSEVPNKRGTTATFRAFDGMTNDFKFDSQL